ncbi:isochorismatase family protein [Klebsiella sp. BIGb0407]|uniref:isochorismatase family protein n=1 Tax=Klebsiella sp. BIGb0407 TaxID=2940603 RepID=UPI002169D36E|nr:isochorismatase family protein [Klebsiella sp. BIGb0407]MCS3429930.1 nicotinamidase-related amidase [Klebsiella sp. BIGb0407]
MSKALLIIDMQKFVTDRIQQGVRFYPENAIENMSGIIETFRSADLPIVHIRHQTVAVGSPLHQDSPLSLPLESFEALANETLFIKNTSSAFNSTPLLSYLQDKNLTDIVVIGAVAGFCVNSTVRTGADSGLNMTVIKDAVISFDLQSHQPGAEEIHDVTMALLGAGFAQVITRAELAS